jgi:hypothetical protein
MPDSLTSLIGPLLSTVAGGVQSAESIDIAKKNQAQALTAENQRTQQYNQLEGLASNPTQLFANINALKQQLTDQEKSMITRSVTAQMIQSGQGGAPGLIQEAVDEALLQADNQRFQEAAQTYLTTLGLPASVLRGQPAASLNPTSGAAAGSFSPAVSGLQSIIAKLTKPSAPGLSGENSDTSNTYNDQANNYFTGLSLGPSGSNVGSYTPDSTPAPTMTADADL